MKSSALPMPAALASVLVAAIAHAGAWGYKTGTETWTDVAGITGGSHADIVTTADYNGLESFKIRDYDHRSCVFEVEESPFAAPMLALLPPAKVCEPTGGEVWKRMDLGAGVFMKAVAVCTSGVKGDTAIRGLEAWGVAIQPDGKLTPRKGSEKLELAGCKKWQPKRSCPEDAVATGVRGFFEETGHGFTGISLRCHALEPRGKTQRS